MKPVRPEEIRAGVLESAAAQRAPAAKGRLLIALTAVYIIWGTTYFATRIALGSFPPFFLAATRFGAAGIALFVVLRVRGEPTPTLTQWRSAAIVGVLLLVGGNGSLTYAQTHVSSSLAAIVVSAMPLFAAVFGAILGARPSRLEIGGLALGFIGVLILKAGGDLGSDGPWAWALVASPVCWALGSVVSGKVPQARGLMAVAAQMLSGAPVQLAIGLSRGERIDHWPAPTAWIAVAYLAVFGSLIGYSAYAYLLRKARPALATSYAYINPILAVALGIGFLDEKLQLNTMIAGAVILCGVALITLARR